MRDNNKMETPQEQPKAKYIVFGAIIGSILYFCVWIIPFLMAAFGGAMDADANSILSLQYAPLGVSTIIMLLFVFSSTFLSKRYNWLKPFVIGMLIPYVFAIIIFNVFTFFVFTY